MGRRHQLKRPHRQSKAAKALGNFFNKAGQVLLKGNTSVIDAHPKSRFMKDLMTTIRVVDNVAVTNLKIANNVLQMHPVAAYEAAKNGYNVKAIIRNGGYTNEQLANTKAYELNPSASNAAMHHTLFNALKDGALDAVTIAAMIATGGGSAAGEAAAEEAAQVAARDAADDAAADALKSKTNREAARLVQRDSDQQEMAASYLSKRRSAESTLQRSDPADVFKKPRLPGISSDDMLRL